MSTCIKDDVGGHVARLLRDNHSHHAGLGDGDECHATWAEMVGGPSECTRQSLEGILNNVHGATPACRLHAKTWLDRNFNDPLKSFVSFLGF